MRKVTKLIERRRIQRMNVDPEFKHVSAMSNCKSQSSGCMHLLFWDQSWNLKFWWTRLLITKGFTCSVCLETSPSRHSGCGVSRNKTYTLPVWCRPDLMPLDRVWLLSLNQDIENRGSLQKNALLDVDFEACIVASSANRRSKQDRMRRFSTPHTCLAETQAVRHENDQNDRASVKVRRGYGAGG